MKRPSALAATLAMCDAVDAHDKAATPGPWEFVAVDAGEAHATGRSPRVVDADDCHVVDATRHEGEAIAAYRTLAPALAARLRVVMEVWPALEAWVNASDEADNGASVLDLVDAYRAATAKLEEMP